MNVIHTFFEDGGKLAKNDGITNRLLAVDYKTFLVDNNLVKVDRATMSVGLEGREPMLDHHVIEFLAQLPSSFKIRDGVNKWLLEAGGSSVYSQRTDGKAKTSFHCAVDGLVP